MAQGKGGISRKVRRLFSQGSRLSFARKRPWGAITGLLPLSRIKTRQAARRPFKAQKSPANVYASRVGPSRLAINSRLVEN